MRDLEDSEIVIYRSFASSKNKCKSFAEHLKKYIDDSTLYIGFVLPSIQQLADETKLSISTVSRALYILAEEHYIQIKRGTPAKVTHPSSRIEDKTLKVDKKLVFNDACMRIGTLNKTFHDDYFRICRSHYAETDPLMQTHSYEPLNITLCEQTNQVQRTSHLYPSFYYLHGYASLLRIIAFILTQNGGAIVVPKIMLHALKDALAYSNATIIEVNCDDEGICIKELDKACAENNVSAVYLMPELSFPDTRSMTERRIKQVLKIQKTWGFHIIADDRSKFWKASESSLFLRVTKNITDKIIYIRPLANLHPELYRITVAFAHPALSKIMREIAGRENQQFYYSNAYAINVLLKRTSYQKQVDVILLALQELNLLVYQIFGASGTWREYGIRQSSGAAIYLEPQQGKFTADAYQKLIAEHIYVVDPASYLHAEDLVNGFRLELTYLIGLHNIDHYLKKVNRVMVSLIELS